MSKVTTNIEATVPGRHGRPVTLDLTYIANGSPKPVLVFAHGFKGFKDWGHWPLIAAAFARKGYVFLKFNFSFNGTTPEQPIDFADLEAFGNNNYTKELDDTDVVLDWLFEKGSEQLAAELDLEKVYMIGHSRGGPITVIKAREDERLKGAITWASVHSLSYAWPSGEFIKNWENEGVYYVLNGRTGQQMPLYYQLYEDCQANKGRFDVKQMLSDFKKPLLILHGAADPAVAVSAARQLHALCPHSQLVVIEGADHVFGGRHPFTSDTLPVHSDQLVECSLDFLKNPK